MQQNTSSNSENAVQCFISTEKDPGSRSWFMGPKQIDYSLADSPLDSMNTNNSGAITINIDPTVKFQEILGIGTSMEETTVFNIMRMSPDKRQEILTRLFDEKKGIGISLVRLTIGTADFTSREFYTYDDLPEGREDPELKSFSIQKDFDYNIIDIVKEAIKINPNLKFFASPWTPPGWMKEKNSEFTINNEYNLRGGKLKTGCIPILAKYYRRFIEEYKKAGIPIYAMTLQNEPLLEINYPSCHVMPEQEKLLAAQLKKEFSEAGLDVKLWVFDHNMADAISYITPIISEAAGRLSVDGIAFHDYSGEPHVMSTVHDSYPEKTVNMTERSWWGTWGADRIVQYFRNWSISYNAWVTMLDSDIKPHQWVGTPDPTMIIQDASVTPNGFNDNYWFCPEYYILGQFSKFIKPGAIRIDSNYGSKETVTNVAFKNPVGSIVVIVVNQTDSEKAVKIVCSGMQINASVPAGAVATYILK